MFRSALFPIAIALFPAISAADEEPVPIWCCPEFCKSADESAVLLRRDDNSGGYDLLLDGDRVPVMEGAFQGTSDASPMKFSVGYDSFGDRQIKCLFVPSIT